MLNLVYKDVRVGLVILLLVVPVFAVGSMAGVRVGPVFFMFTLVFASALVLGMSQMDWRHGVDRFIHSLPVSRTLVVRARYVSALLAGALALAIGGTVGVLRGLALVGAGRPWPRWVSVDVALAWVLLFAIVVALYLPCYFRWGHGKGYIIGALVIAAGVIAGGLARQVLEQRVSPEGLPDGLIVSVVVDAASRVGLPLAALFVLALSAILLLLSARISARAYRGREF